MTPILTLTTDFGTRDSYVAEMKGVLLSQGPRDLRLTDLTHTLEPYRVHEAALFLRAAVPRFPEGTVHLVVVDPGVGSERRALVAESHGQRFVGPDNGVLGYLLHADAVVHEIDPDELGGGPISRTFHGRDLFAPAAAKLASGVSLEALGPRVERYEHMVFPMVEFVGDDLRGRVIHVDRFGNAVTNVTADQLLGFLGDAAEADLEVHVARRTVKGLSQHYSQRERGEALALIGSAGLLEVAVREGSAATKLGAAVGDHVRVTR